MTGRDFAQHLAAYGASFDAPVREDSNVTSVSPNGRGYLVVTDRGTWQATSVVIATGYSDQPAVPQRARRLATSLTQLTTTTYDHPGDLPDGGVLVVGASASGVQIADELRTAGRDVVLAIGNHTRLPRVYRGMDIMWWLDSLGSLDRSVDEIADAVAARREPSMQLVGRPSRDDLDLPALQAKGVVLTGRLVDADNTRVTFADDLPETTTRADEKMRHVLDGVDAFVETNGFTSEVFEADRPKPFRPPSAPTRLDAADRGIRTVIWATGYRRSYAWLNVPVLDADGEIQQRYGVTSVPGIYTVGQRFQTRRSSSFISGVGHDAAAVAANIQALRPVLRRSTVLTTDPR
jgi:putative flavoprotein involved in K+ transport